MSRKPLVPGRVWRGLGSSIRAKKSNYLRWTPQQLAYYADVPLWLIEELESGQIQDTDGSNKRKIVKAVEIAYQGPGKGLPGFGFQVFGVRFSGSVFGTVSTRYRLLFDPCHLQPSTLNSVMTPDPRWTPKTLDGSGRAEVDWVSSIRGGSYHYRHSEPRAEAERLRPGWYCVVTRLDTPHLHAPHENRYYVPADALADFLAGADNGRWR